MTKITVDYSKVIEAKDARIAALEAELEGYGELIDAISDLEPDGWTGPPSPDDNALALVRWAGKRITDLHDAGMDASNDVVYYRERALAAERERDEARAEAERLRAALQAIHDWTLHQVTEGEPSKHPAPGCAFCGAPGTFHLSDPDEHWPECPQPKIHAALGAEEE